jgi:hypothetical protein
MGERYRVSSQEMYPDVRDAMRKHGALPVPVGEATLWPDEGRGGFVACAQERGW